MKQRAPRRLHIEVGFRTLLLAALTVGLCVLLIVLWPILVTVMTALMFLGMLSPLVAWLERKGMRRGWAIATVVLVLGVATLAFLVFLIPALLSQVADLLVHVPEATAAVAKKLAEFPLTAPFAESIRLAQSHDLIANAGKSLFAHSVAVAEVVAYGFSALSLALYLMIDRDRMRGAAFSLVPMRYHVRLSRVLLKLQDIVGDYLRGQVLTSLFAGVFTFLVLTVFRVPNSLALASFAALVDVLPYVGAALACVPSALAAYSRGAPVALAVLACLAAYQQLESRLIIPSVYGRALRLPSVIVLLALLIGGNLMGILGALLALPIAAGIRMMVEELRLELPGDSSDNSRIEARDRAGERTFEELTAGASPADAAAVATEIAQMQIAADALNAKLAKAAERMLALSKADLARKARQSRP